MSIDVMTEQEYIEHPLDALGNPIIVGGTYGYSQSSNGHSHSSSGTVQRVTPKGMVSLHITMKRECLYNKSPQLITINQPLRATVKPIHLFPIGK